MIKAMRTVIAFLVFVCLGCGGGSGSASKGQKRVVFSDTHIETFELKFVPGTLELTEGGDRFLGALAETLNGNPNIAKVSANVHREADSRPGLAQERAQFLVDQLVERGVASDRLVANGSDQPNPKGDGIIDFEILERRER